MVHTAKRWAQERNWAKYRLESVRSTLRDMMNSDIITKSEKVDIVRAHKHITFSLVWWKAGNVVSKKSCVK